MAQVVGSLTPTWETSVEFPAPGFGSGPALTIAGIRGLNRQKGTLDFSISVSHVSTKETRETQVDKVVGISLDTWVRIRF